MPRTIENDWFDGVIPDNVVVEEGGYVETSQSFERYRSEVEVGLRVARGASVYPPTMFDLGPEGSVNVGEFSMLNGPRILCDGRISIGAYCLISWNVVLMDSYRAGFDVESRRGVLGELWKAPLKERRMRGGDRPREIRIGDNVWIGFDAVILPGVQIGEGSVVGARSVVNADVPAYCVVAGNPARVVKQLRKHEGSDPRMNPNLHE
jgi:acetyltransferase-like isoleucine patch superfamily enzyme